MDWSFYRQIFFRSSYFKSPYSLFCQLFRLLLKIEWEKNFSFPFFWLLFQKWVCCHKKTLKNNQGTWEKSPYSLFWKSCFWKKFAFTIECAKLMQCVSYFIYIQPLNFAYIRLLNKPYENEVTLTGQNPPLKCCQPLELLAHF